MNHFWTQRKILLPALVALATTTIPLVAATSVQAQVPHESDQAVAKKHLTDHALRADIKFLADDLLEGRGPGTRGDQLAQKYIASQFELIGLQPAGADGTFFQPFPMLGVTTRPPESISFEREGQTLEFRNSDDFVFTCGKPIDKSEFEDAEIVFVGYGMQAPEYGWDDFKDVDVKGKVLLIMNNDPQVDDKNFAGKTRLYYGRWDYKYAKAAEMGAAGAIIIHTDESAGYPYQVVQTSWTGEQMALSGMADRRVKLEGWLTDDAAKQVAEFGGHDLDELREAAESKDFRPVSLGSTLSLSMDVRVRERQTANVLGLLKGSDPVLSNQWLIYTAHHDHIGLADARDERGDNIYNGAVDNASGIAVMLGIARAFCDLPESSRPKRSVLFAAVGAEEQGLLGSEFLANNPPIPAGNLAAVINIDGVNILGATHDVVVVGRGKSNMDKTVEQLALWQDRVVVADQFPEKGFYYRSDQFSLAKVGVPGVYLGSGTHVVGKPAEWGPQQMREWTENIYHQTSDEYREDWNLSGALQDAELMLHIGIKTANQSEMPAWTPGDEFEAARLNAIEALGK